jgi:hypothetical protein
MASDAQDLAVYEGIGAGPGVHRNPSELGAVAGYGSLATTGMAVRSIHALTLAAGSPESRVFYGIRKLHWFNS